MSNNTSVSHDSSYVIHCPGIFYDIYMSTAIFITRALLLYPLCIFVLHLGYRQWRQQRSFATTSHSDIFTYHMVGLEMIFALGWIIYLSGEFNSYWNLTVAGFHLTSIVIPGQIGFHVLTCVERYLAVVHPVLYLKLKQPSAIRIRNIISLWGLEKWAGT
ncbi:somatostatin receptor type 5-like [Xyrichtys novacula]|uniref:Somatostatin receptor type 5-like n=1 Tax=Xyrichtys novacula TaxID=13765 RepID=A0AAV1EHW9_XYRNO|nr:somatostatin receptor type 5-like [Xyrichtys novacula]CAJ1048257.1 somatostatin receptor type 5-like [Xyrichtys novacula]